MVSRHIKGSGEVFCPGAPLKAKEKNLNKSTTCRLPAVLEEMQVSPEELKGAAQVKTSNFYLRNQRC